MSRKEKKEKVKKPGILSKNAIVTMILLFLWVTIADGILSTILTTISGGYKGYKQIYVNGKIDYTAAQQLGMNSLAITMGVISIILIFVLYHFRLRKDFKGVLAGKDRSALMRVAIIGLCILVYDVITISLDTGFDFSKVNYYFFIYAVSAGISEEITYRAVLVPHMFKVWKDIVAQLSRQKSKIFIMN